MALFGRVQPSFLASRRTLHLLSYPARRERLGQGHGVLVLGVRSSRMLKLSCNAFGSSLGLAGKGVSIAQSSGLVYFPRCCVHTQADGMMAAAAKESQREVRSSGGSKGHVEDHGSVLMQFVGKKEEPKALTVGAKGKSTTLF